MSLKTQQDAHLLSNSKEKWVNDLTVIVNLDGKVKPETVQKVIDCIKQGKIFVLHNSRDQLFYYNPLNNWGQWKTTGGQKTDFKFNDRRALLNSVKLSLIELNHVLIPSVQNPASGPRIEYKKKKLCR